MLTQYGQETGFQAGQDDAATGNPANPRPSLYLALISKGYLNAFLRSYRQGHQQQTRVDREVQIRQEIFAQSRAPKHSQTSRDQSRRKALQKKSRENQANLER